MIFQSTKSYWALRTEANTCWTNIIFNLEIIHENSQILFLFYSPTTNEQNNFTYLKSLIFIPFKMLPFPIISAWGHKINVFCLVLFQYTRGRELLLNIWVSLMCTFLKDDNICHIFIIFTLWHVASLNVSRQCSCGRG